MNIFRYLLDKMMNRRQRTIMEARKRDFKNWEFWKKKTKKREIKIEKNPS